MHIWSANSRHFGLNTRHSELSEINIRSFLPIILANSVLYLNISHRSHITCTSSRDWSLEAGLRMIFMMLIVVHRFGLS
jgi:hypothetical protein